MRAASVSTSGPRQGGFTLVELLAAVVVLGFVIVMLSQGLRFGVRAASLVDGEHVQDLLAAEQAVRHVIEEADPGTYPEPATLRGTATALSLTSELPGGGGPPRRADAVLLALDGRLVLRWRPHRHVEAFGPEPPWTDTVVIEAVESVGFAYFARSGAGGWSASWDGEALPGYVRVVVAFPAGSRLRWPPMIIPTLREPIEE